MCVCVYYFLGVDIRWARETSVVVDVVVVRKLYKMAAPELVSK